jgi:hypothetical protein
MKRSQGEIIFNKSEDGFRYRKLEILFDDETNKHIIEIGYYKGIPHQDEEGGWNEYEITNNETIIPLEQEEEEGE